MSPRWLKVVVTPVFMTGVPAMTVITSATSLVHVIAAITTDVLLHSSRALPYIYIYIHKYTHTHTPSAFHIRTLSYSP